MLAEEMIAEARKKHENGLSYDKIAKELGVHRWDVWRALTSSESHKKEVPAESGANKKQNRGKLRKVEIEEPSKPDIPPSPDDPDYWRHAIVQECEKLRRLLLAKNHDYGASAFQAPLLTPGVSVEDGILLRIGDKFRRLGKFGNSGFKHFVCESKADTVRDIAGYMLLLLVWYEHQKKAEKSR